MAQCIQSARACPTGNLKLFLRRTCVLKTDDASADAERDHRRSGGVEAIGVFMMALFFVLFLVATPDVAQIAFIGPSRNQQETR